MARDPLPLRYRIDDREVSGETLAMDAGPYGLHLSSTLEDEGLRLHAAYVASPSDPRVLVAEFADTGRRKGSLASRWIEGEPHALAFERSALLLDHLGRLQGLAHEAGLRLRVDDESIERSVREIDPLARA